MGDGAAAEPGRERVGPLPQRVRVRAQRREDGRDGTGEGRLDRGERELVGADRTGQRVAGEARDHLASAQQDPGLRTAEELVAAGDDHVGARGEGRGGIGLVGQRGLGAQQSRAEIGDQRQPVLVRERGELGDPDLAGEALDAVVAGVDLEDRADGRLVRGSRLRARPRGGGALLPAGAGRERLAVVARMGAVGGADLSHPRPGGGDELREPEPGPDLDELPAAPQHLAARGERGRGQQEGGRAVVHHERVLRRGAGGQQRGPRAGAAAGAGAGGEVELDVGVPGGVLDRLPGCGRERGPAEVGVDDDAGRVQHRAQRGGAVLPEGGEHRGGHVLRGDLAATGPVLGGADQVVHHALPHRAARRDDLGQGEQAIRARDPPTGVLRAGACRAGALRVVADGAVAAPARGRRALSVARGLGHGTSCARDRSVRPAADGSIGGGGRESNPPDRDARSHQF